MNDKFTYLFREALYIVLAKIIESIFKEILTVNIKY